MHTPPAVSPERRDRAPLWRLALLLLLGSAVLALGLEQRQARALVAHEDGALAALRRVFEAQQRHRERAGRYGWLDEIRPLLDAADTAPPGYRIDVLLPGGRDPLGHVLLVEAQRAAHEPLLAARHVALVARPTEPGITGWRTFYLDENGRAYVSEGVYDWQSASENALPRTRVEGPRLPQHPGPVWRALDDLHGVIGGDAAKD